MGLFKVRRSDGKLNLQLYGDFDTENMEWIFQLFKRRRFFCCKVFELDMSEVGTISSEALSQLFIILQILQERETKTFMTGLDSTRLIVPHEPGKRSASQITTYEEKVSL